MLPSDIFISYASDDQAAPGVIGAQGLVTSLHNRLLANFERLGKSQPTIYRDTQQIVLVNQFGPQVRQALVEAKVILLVLSRNWLDSPRCHRELEFFLACWRQRSESDQRIKERIFVVRAQGNCPTNRPALIKGVCRYDLMSVDPDNLEEFQYFDSTLGRPCDERWYTCVRKLSQDLHSRLCGLGVGLPAAEPASPPVPAACAGDAFTVYVARPAVDMEQSYATLVEELRRRGYRVVPDPDTPLARQHLAALRAIDSALDESIVSIHLLGEKRGFQPEGAAPIVRLQLERAASKVISSAALGGSEPRRFHRLVWAPRVVPGQPEDAAVREPLEVVATHAAPAAGDAGDAALHVGDRLHAGTLTEFSQFVLQHLEEAFGPTAGCARVAPRAQVYVQHDEGDSVVAGQVADGLTRLGFAPVLSPIEGSADERRQIHGDYLQTADAVLLCWGYASPVWVRAAANELRRWQCLGRSRPFASRTVVALPPQIDDKKRMCQDLPNADLDSVIDATTAPPVRPYVLELFLRQLGGERT